MSNPLDDQRQWLEDILARMNITASELARRARLNPSTLTRFLNRQGGEGHTLTFRTISKIEQATGAARQKIQTAGGMGERSAAPFDMDVAANALATAIRALIGMRNAADPWEILNNDLANIGLVKGDVVIVDMNEQPLPGDIVCAQIYEPEVTRTVFRLWEPPYLLSGSTAPGARRPVVVDNTNALIKGTVIARLSPRFGKTTGH